MTTARCLRSACLLSNLHVCKPAIMRPVVSNYMNATEKQNADTFRLKIKKRSDRLMNYFFGIYFFGGFVCACFYNTWWIALIGSSFIIGIYYAVKKATPGSAVYQYVLSAILGIFMAQYIYQMRGMFEVYFFAFIGSAILIMYQNWRLQIPLLIIVILHLSVFGYHNGSGIQQPYVTTLSGHELNRYILHILLASLVFFICGLWAYLLNKYSEIQIAQTAEMKRMQTDALLFVKEQASTESDNRLRYAAQATSDAIWDRNYSEDAVFWGEGYRTLFGFDITPETTTVSFWASRVHPEDIQEITRISREAKENPKIKTWSVEYRFRKADGEYAFVREKAIILRDDKGIPYRTIGALQDITTSKRNEIILKALNEDLEKEKYYLDSLMDNLPDAIYFKDKESRFLRVSKYMVNKLLSKHPGATINDLLGKTDFDLQDKVHAKEAYDDEQEIQRTGIPKINYIEKEIADGTERWVATTKLPLVNAQGEVVGTFGVSKDITKMKMLEQQQNAAMIEKAMAQGKYEIASEVMHDIGNAVVGFGSYLTRIRRLQNEDSHDNLKNLAAFFEKQKHALTTTLGETKADAVIKLLATMAQTQKANQEDINKSIAEQLNIITNIQEILNIQRQYVTGYESQERKTVNMRNVIHDSLAMLNGSLDKRAIDVSLNIPAELPIIKGDRTKLMQVLLNILRNSIDAIDINAVKKSISVNAYTNADQLVLEVRDNGKGFDKITAEQLFGKGFTTKSSSSGMGLYNCKAILNSHEGIIAITSDGEGKGALVTMGLKYEMSA
jgi:PAS domain S-box-containing protein